MLRPFFSMLLTSLAAGSAIAAPVAPPTSEPSADRLAQIYMGDTPMATTYGRGFATAPADIATLNYSFSRYNYSAAVPASDTTVPLFAATDREAIVAAFVAEGIAPEDIDANLSNYDLRVAIELDAPSQTKLDRLNEVAQQLAIADGTFFLNNSYSSCGLSDFTPVENEARINAIAESRSRIDAMAEALDAEVGAILSTIEVHGYAPVSSSCDPSTGGMGTLEVTIELGVMTTFELIQ
ncbi:MAG: SIMPL domain-containing protein [Geitlerinemataceae cyanobacterium]